MRTRSRYVLSLTVVAAVAVSGCGGETKPSQGTEPPANATGVITAVEPSEGDVKSFVLETENFGSIELEISDEVDYGFDLAHLREHMESGDPVRVEIDGSGDEAYALSIVDV